MIHREHIFTDGTRLDCGTLYCIGRNYAEHANEMGAAIPTEPMVFLKPTTSYFNKDYVFELPDFTTDVHHELELVVVIGKDCRNVSSADALDYIAGYGIGIDFTARDVQAIAKQKGHPWTKAKAFYKSAPCSEIVPASELNSLNFEYELFKNEIKVQAGKARDMIFSVASLMEYLSKIYYLTAGDCVYTGTPSGVGAVKSGDELLVRLKGFVEFNLSIE